MNPRKVPVTINLNPLVKNAANAWAKANEKSLSVLIEDLLKDHFKEHGVNAYVDGGKFSKDYAKGKITGDDEASGEVHGELK